MINGNRSNLVVIVMVLLAISILNGCIDFKLYNTLLKKEDVKAEYWTCWNSEFDEKQCEEVEKFNWDRYDPKYNQMKVAYENCSNEHLRLKQCVYSEEVKSGEHPEESSKILCRFSGGAWEEEKCSTKEKINDQIKKGIGCCGRILNLGQHKK